MPDLNWNWLTSLALLLGTILGIIFKYITPKKTVVSNTSIDDLKQRVIILEAANKQHEKDIDRILNKFMDWIE